MACFLAVLKMNIEKIYNIKEILLIEKKGDNLMKLQKIMRELGIDDFYNVEEYVQAIQIINLLPPDIIICNSYLLKKELREQLSAKMLHLSIPLLWTIPSKETCCPNDKFKV